MPNSHLLGRLKGIQKNLMALHGAGGNMSAASRGREREHFLELFLYQVFPPTFRFGSGDITDQRGVRSGQLDLVVEYPFLPSFPLVGPGPRLYLAEAVAAVIEVKSDLRRQWREVERSARALRKLQRNFDKNSIHQIGDAPKHVPLFVAAYRGWRNLETLAGHLKPGFVEAILVIEDGLFAYKGCFGSLTATNSHALGAFVDMLHRTTNMLKVADLDMSRYLKVKLDN